MTVGWIIVIIIAIAAYLAHRYRRADAFLKQAHQPIELASTGDYWQEIVGESSYQSHLRRVAGRGEVRHECQAMVEPEDDNPHDDKAVIVLIDGKTAGYLSRADARRFRKTHGSPVTCGALIVGGGKGRENLGVWLDLRL